MGRPVRRRQSKSRRNRRVSNSHHSNRQMLPSPTSKQIQVTVTTKLAPTTTVSHLTTTWSNKSKITTQRGEMRRPESRRSRAGTPRPSSSSKWPERSPLAANRAAAVHPPAPKRPIEKQTKKHSIHMMQIEKPTNQNSVIFVKIQKKD